MPRSNGEPAGLSVLVPLATIILVVATLHYARDVLVPICLAVLLTFVLSPVVSWFQKLRLKRIPAAIIVTALFVAGAGALTWIVARQVVNVAVQLPEYKANIEKKWAPARAGKLGALINSFREVQSGVSAPIEEAQRSGAQTSARTKRESQPTPAIVVESRPFGLLSTLLGPVLGPTVTIFVVIVFSVFMLAERELLRNKILRLAGRGHLTTTTRALDEAAQRVSRYLLFQTLVNVGYGAVAAFALNLIGVPNPLLWGLLSGLLRYIPYVGPVCGAAFPTLLALGAFADWHRALYVLFFYIVLEVITANFVEPSLYGAQTGLSALAILVSAIFWTVIWGPVGLLLSTPLTVCLVAFGKHVPHLEFVAILLGDEPALSPSVKVYQRLLADDPDEALEISNSFLADHSLEDLYDTVLVPVLSMAEQDRRRGALTDTQENVVLDNLRELIEDLPDRTGTSKPETHKEYLGRGDEHLSLLAVPARNAADEIGAMLLAKLVNRWQPRLEVLSAAPLKESIREVSAGRPQMICISSVPPFSLRHTRALYRSLKQMQPNMQIVVGVWSFEGPNMSLHERMGVADPDKVATTLCAAAHEIETFLEENAITSQT
jgi:predicted PurR-regulated permease PerM